MKMMMMTMMRRTKMRRGACARKVRVLNGACPNRSFTVAGRTVTTHAGTRFDDVSCGSLATGMEVEVRGSRQSNGSILADRVKRED